MTVSQMENMSKFLLFLAILFLAVSIVLFFVFDIRKIYKIISGNNVIVYKDIGADVSEKSINEKKQLVKDNEFFAITEKILYESTGSKTEDLSSDVMNKDLLITMPISGCNNEEDLKTELLRHSKNEGSESTQLLDDNGIRVLQDITYTNGN